MARRICPSCGQGIGPGSHHCMYCGAAIEASVPTAPHSSSNQRTRGHLKSGTSVGQLVSLVVLAVVAGIVILFFLGICG